MTNCNRHLEPSIGVDKVIWQRYMTTEFPDMIEMFIDNIFPMKLPYHDIVCNKWVYTLNLQLLVKISAAYTESVSWWLMGAVFVPLNHTQF
jgi:hypothetical protein